MDTTRDIFDIFEHDESFMYIMKRLLETSMAESFNSILITEAGPGFPIVYANAAFSELTGYAPGEVMGPDPPLIGFFKEKCKGIIEALVGAKPDKFVGT